MSADAPSPSPSTPGASDQGDGKGNFKDSIAALRSILMIDTPTKSLLSGQHPSVADQRSQYEERKVHWNELSKLRDTTSQLRHRVQKATIEAANETKKRKTLQTTYDALAKHKKELSVQLELVTKSREAAEEKLDAMRKDLREERERIAKERVQWKPELDRLSREKTRFEKEADELRSQYQIVEQKVRTLEARVEHLKTTLNKTEEKLQTKEISQAALQPRVEQAETARQKAEDSLAAANGELDATKRRHRKSLGSMLGIQQNLKKELSRAQDEKKAAETKLEKAFEDLRTVEAAKQAAMDKINGSNQGPKNFESYKIKMDEKVGPVLWCTEIWQLRVCNLSSLCHPYLLLAGQSPDGRAERDK